MKPAVLVAEDDTSLNSIYVRKLTDAGFAVTAVSDGLSVLSELQKHPAQLILLDLMMPGKDGFLVLKELKADPRTRHIPVIVVSNLDQPENRELCRKYGAAEYVVKTDTTINGLVGKVKDLLE